MSEQKMREALELAIHTMQRNVIRNCNHGQTSGLYAAIFKCQEALAAPSGEQVELTDAELMMIHSAHWLDESPDCFVAACRAVIAAHEAKRNGGAV